MNDDQDKARDAAKKYLWECLQKHQDDFPPPIINGATLDILASATADYARSQSEKEIAELKEKLNNHDTGSHI